jgi:hypothetical protein
LISIKSARRHLHARLGGFLRRQAHALCAGLLMARLVSGVSVRLGFAGMRARVLLAFVAGAVLVGLGSGSPGRVCFRLILCAAAAGERGD